MFPSDRFPLAMRSLFAQLHAPRPTVTPPLGGDIPVCGKTYELFLLRDDRILSAPCEQKIKTTGRTLTEAFDIGHETATRIRHYLDKPDHDFLALLLSSTDRLLLIAAVPGLTDRQGVAFLFRSTAHIRTTDIARVLCYSFGGCVALDESVRRYADMPLRKCDENAYIFLKRLFCLWRQLIGGTVRNSGVHIEDRRELSRQLRTTGRCMLTLLGLPPDTVGAVPFPIPYPFCGNYHPARTAWTLLCLWCGLRHRPTAETCPAVHEIADNERLLPMFEFSTGNRSPLPIEWEECRDIAEQYGMLFEVKRTKNAIRICLCPMTPDTTPTLFYNLRAPNSLLWQLRAALQITDTPMQ